MISDSLRTVKVLKNGKWLDTEFDRIKKGDIIKMFEPTGEPVRGFAGVTEFKALCDAYMDMEHHVHALAIKEVV